MKRFKAYLYEIFLLFINIRYLNYIQLEYRDKEDSSIDTSKFELMKSPWKLMSNGKEKTFYRISSPNYSYQEGNPSKEAIYINGIKTNEVKARHEAYELSKYFNKPFTIFLNQTNGFLEDLYDSIRMKVGNKDNKESKLLSDYICHRYHQYNVKSFFIVAYSQGSIITSHAIERLPDAVKSAIKINLITLGPAQDSLKSFTKKGAVLHVAHNKDFVARMGVLSYIDKNEIKGTLIKIDKYTHRLETYIKTLEDMKKLSIEDNNILQSFISDL